MWYCAIFHGLSENNYESVMLVMNIRISLYKQLVNKHPGISYRYHRMHDNSHGAMKAISWVYLLWLNLAYYVLFMRFLGKKPDAEIYESKRLNYKMSESEAYLKAHKNLDIDKLVEKLSSYDVVSFDIFDTLIFRAVDTPIDVFYYIGEKLGIPNFRGIRTWAEYDARVKCYDVNEHMEIGLEDIWENLIEDVGGICSPKEGMELELQTELKLCYANPFMLEVWNRLKELGQEIVIVSDMYLSSGMLARILNNAGYDDLPKIFVSCEHGVSKSDGKLYKLAKEEYAGKSMIHVGDNPHSDIEMARKNGLDVYLYPNINGQTMLYRPFDMSYLIGSAYRAMVSAHIYNGRNAYSMEYEYGFIYGGLFVLGYCRFIHDYCKGHDIDKVLFLSRDGDILLQVYALLYPEEKTDYVYWSRKAATKLMANLDRHDYFRRFIYHKINQDYTVKDILKAMELEALCDELGDWPKIWEDWCAKRPSKKARKFIELRASDELTEKNGYLLRIFIEAKWEYVSSVYDEQNRAASLYYKKKLDGCSRVAAVDIGWAGSGALALNALVNKAWGLECEVVGIIAGTNTIHNFEPDATECFLQSGQLVSYLYSASDNRDVWKKHDPNKDYNVFWELLLSSPQPKFNGFTLNSFGEVDYSFGGYDPNIDGIKEVQTGIMDFVKMYHERFKEYPYMEDISGRDAYAPMIVAASYGEKYLKAIEKKFGLEINVV